MSDRDLREAANSKVQRGTPIDLLEIGPRLVIEMHFTEDEVVNALYAMQSAGLIQMLDGNRIRVL
ncbi:hypothetical protein [Rhizobium grahamii]|uniref:Uncharacterized protein n=2 Tax=Rhizobium grahamii TaxID=1120045 RepID=S3HGM2_9HYPH|nr:hypothetical protein [Rhizobium grahamii]EPE97190.1 hypothetical protein RGCCGE502_16530 [Rhizobium grahamii CCGE 502]RDJ02760.1 hypothetical protein B5K06_32350 [Rhizobium grahamii]